MADPSPGDKTKLKTKLTSEADTRYLATAYGLREDDVKKIVTAPTAELAKFITSALDKARVCDKLEAEKRCRFTELPPEIRLRIYELAFHDELKEIYHKDEGQLLTNHWYSRGDHAVRYVKVALKLAHTCQMLRAEVLPACIKVTRTIDHTLDLEFNNLEPFKSVHFMGPGSFREYKKVERRRALKARRQTANETHLLLQAAAENSLQEKKTRWQYT